jgi:ABC-2 type transport system permease protein
MKAFFHHFLYELKAGVRDRSQLFMNWLFPLIVFVMMAALMGGINPAFKAQMLPAMMLFGMMSSGFLSLPNGWITPREAGVFRSFRINRVPAWAVLAAPVLATLVHMAGVSAIIALAGTKIFGGAPPADWAAFICGWLASAFAVCGLGMAIGTLMPNPRAGMLVSQFLYLPSIMLGGLMFPSSLLPKGLGAVSRFLPASWSMEAMQAVWGGTGAGSRPCLAPLVLAATGFAGFLVSLALFEWHSSPTRRPAWRLAGLMVLVPSAAAALETLFL